MAEDMLREFQGGSSQQKALLAQGSQGQDVKELQQALNRLGYDVGTADGIFGLKTEAGLKAFQQASGIGVDGIAGQETYNALQNATPNTNKPNESQSQQTPQQQQQTQQQTKQTPNTPVVPPTSYATTPNFSIGSDGAQGLQGYSALLGKTAAENTQDFSNLNREAMAPYEELIRQYISGQPSYTPRTEEELLALARQQASLAIDPQRLALTQQLEELQRQGDVSRQRIEADYQGSEDAVQRALALARQQATESAIARGGGRSGQVDYFSEKLQQPIMTGFQQQQAQKAASLANIESSLGQGQRQYQQSLQQLAQQEGGLTQQQLAALRDVDYARGQESWQLGLQGAMGLAGLAGQQNLSNLQMAANMLPYLYLTEGQRQQQPMDWAQIMGITPSTMPQPSQIPYQSTTESLVPVRAYAASQGRGDLVDWDEGKREVIVNGVRIPIDDFKKLGGKVEDGTSYLPASYMKTLLGVG